MKNRTELQHLQEIHRKNFIFKVKNYLRKVTNGLIIFGAIVLINEVANIIMS